MTLYEKRGRRYVPVADDSWHWNITNGAWLVIIDHGRTTIRELVEPDEAGFLAATDMAREAMRDAMRKASDCRPRDGKLTARERKAYEAWRAVMGEETMWLTRDSASDIVDAGIEAVRRAFRERKTEREGVR